MSIIACREVCFEYENTVVLENISFAVERGSRISIIGENGSGKSTLVKGLLGLKKPCKGEIIAGEGLKNSEIGYLPQQSGIRKDFPAGVFEVVLSGLQNRKEFHMFYTLRHKRAAMDNLRKMGILDLKNRCFAELSGGQQQRVLLARALCSAQKLIILDEPSSGLDSLVTRDFYSLVGELNRNSGITTITVSHDISYALEHSTHILDLHNKQLFFGETADYLKTGLKNRFYGGGDNK